MGIKREHASYTAGFRLAYATKAGLQQSLINLVNTPKIKVHSSILEDVIHQAPNAHHNQCYVDVEATYGPCYGTWPSDLVDRINEAISSAGCKASIVGGLTHGKRTIHHLRDLDKKTFWNETTGYIPGVIPNLPKRSKDYKKWKEWYDLGGKNLQPLVE